MAITTTGSLARGPKGLRCQQCRKYKTVVRIDHNGQSICSDCDPALLDLIRPAEGPPKES